MYSDNYESDVSSESDYNSDNENINKNNKKVSKVSNVTSKVISKSTKADKVNKPEKTEKAKSSKPIKKLPALTPEQLKSTPFKSPKIKKDKTIEEKYQKVSQIEHILLRPDTYIGSVEHASEEMWVFNNNTKRMEYKQISFVPGLYKIFDEILVNAADNKQRDPTMSYLKVNIDQDRGIISVMNNGSGIPVEIHKTEGIYVPELIFGHLLTSSNYNDAEQKTTGGRNGYGAKLTNIFSTEFTVETSDSKTGLKYKQIFRNNMGTKGEPLITKATGSDFTKITFRPDFSKFHMPLGLDSDIISLLSRRVYDIAGASDRSLKVYLNDEQLAVKNFESYTTLYLSDGTSSCREAANERWEVIVAHSDGHFQQVSFVNSIATTKGGTHVNYITDQVCKHICSFVEKKHKGCNLKPFHVKNHMFLFINALIVNPAFDSQTKENLTSRASSFGSKCELTDKFLKALEKSTLVEKLIEFATAKKGKELSKNDGKKKSRLNGIPKLEDATEAGGRLADKCTLILTEGDSAKTLAISGFSVVGRDFYGVFPLKGKLLNVRDAAHTQVMANQEITHLKQILGLQQGKVYTDTKSLRYGHLMIMTDQDNDGSHIKGLVINFIHHYWPSLLLIPDFLCEFITPIVKANKGTGNSKIEKVFFTLPEYENWKNATPNWKTYEIKYYKGLGTSTRDEARTYFSDLNKHRIEFEWSGEEDGKLIEMAFAKKLADARKQWISECKEGTFVDHSTGFLNYSDFINKELVLFSIADNKRSIPNIMDGLKPGQRKILYGCFLKNLKAQIKVAQLTGFIGEKTAYHHGEVSLQGTIVGMAQNYVGSNNINLLEPCGQFGTRLCGGKDAASARYIFTKISPLTRLLFSKFDDALLKYLDDDGLAIEPSFYAPIIPLCLVNGTSGIGTGWSTDIPSYNPKDLIRIVKEIVSLEDDFEAIKNMDIESQLKPWYRGFTGTIIQKAKGDGYQIDGVLEEIDDVTVKVTELPIGTWTQTYKEFLEELITENVLKEYKNYSTDTQICFILEFVDAAKLSAYLAAGIMKKLKLTTSVTTSNMVMFDTDENLQKYQNVADIVFDFFKTRGPMYQKRKSHMADLLTNELSIIENRVRFIKEVITNKLVVSNRKKSDLINDLRSRGYTSHSLKKKVESDVVENDENGDAPSPVVQTTTDSYDYLLGMQIWSLTYEKVTAFENELETKKVELDNLLATHPYELWIRDLDAFEAEYDKYEEDRVAVETGKAGSKFKINKKPLAPIQKKKIVSKKKKNSDSEESDSMDISDSEELDNEEFVAESKKKVAAPFLKPKLIEKSMAGTKVAPKVFEPLKQTKIGETMKPLTKKVLKENFGDDEESDYEAHAKKTFTKSVTMQVKSRSDSPVDVFSPKKKSEVQKSLQPKPSTNSFFSKSVDPIDVDEDIPMSLSDRLKAKMNGFNSLTSKPAAKKSNTFDESDVASIKISPPTVKNSSIALTSKAMDIEQASSQIVPPKRKLGPKSTTADFEFIDSEEAEAPKKAKVINKSKPASKAYDFGEAEEDEKSKKVVAKVAIKSKSYNFDDDEEEDIKPKKNVSTKTTKPKAITKPTTTKPTKVTKEKKPASKKSKKNDSDDDISESEFSDNDDVGSVPVSQSSRPARAAVATKKKYVESEEEDSVMEISDDESDDYESDD